MDDGQMARTARRMRRVLAVAGLAAISMLGVAEAAPSPALVSEAAAPGGAGTDGGRWVGSQDGFGGAEAEAQGGRWVGGNRV